MLSYLLTGAVRHVQLHGELAVVHDRLDVARRVLRLVHLHAVAPQLFPNLVQKETPAKIMKKK